MRIRNLALPVLAAAALFATAARAQMPEVPPGKWWKRPAIVKELALTAEQQGKLDEIFAKNRRDFIDLKVEVEKKQLDVEELMAKKDSDPKRVSVAIDALEQSRAKLRKAASLMVLDMRGVLTAEQWKKVVERREQWRQERREQIREHLREFRPRRGAERGAPPPPGPPPSTKDQQ
jgi:Spy/CpxP family protein refolding chaperone